MADLYEFRVAGEIGPVIRSAIPELTAHLADQCSILTGCAHSPHAFADVLRQLEVLGLVETEIFVCRVSADTCHGG